jgi:predicted transcriptional regulator of viral defense system
MGVPAEALEPLQAFPVRTDYRLDPQNPSAGQRSARWRILENLESGRHA